MSQTNHHDGEMKKKSDGRNRRPARLSSVAGEPKDNAVGMSSANVRITKCITT